MSVEIIRGAGPSGIDIAYERFGDPDAPPVLLVMGLATQMLGWPDGFCSALVSPAECELSGLTIVTSAFRRTCMTRPRRM